MTRCTDDPIACDNPKPSNKLQIYEAENLWRGYRPLQPHEVDYAEFRSNGVPFALVSKVPHRPQPPTTASPD